jgi:endonuclease YncB( thermonuclease family)
LLSIQASAFSSSTCEIELNGEPTKVYFNDGDTFKVLTGPLTGAKSRLVGYNTLETWGPVHRWGDFRAVELFDNANQATKVARRGGWHCTTDLSPDTYGRILSLCTDLGVELIKKGLAHAMSATREPAIAPFVNAQHEAMAARTGMWEKGIPEYILTSTHSRDEKEGQRTTYDRFVSTQDGHSELAKHSNNYADCEEVCYAPRGASRDGMLSCMTFVRYENRYGPTKASCLKRR